jgi:hypothetical protein
VAGALPAITSPAQGLTDAFYVCRYSRDPAGPGVLAAARERLEECRKVLSRFERLLPP